VKGRRALWTVCCRGYASVSKSWSGAVSGCACVRVPIRSRGNTCKEEWTYCSISSPAFCCGLHDWCIVESRRGDEIPAMLANVPIGSHEAIEPEPSFTGIPDHLDGAKHPGREYAGYHRAAAHAQQDAGAEVFANRRSFPLLKKVWMKSMRRRR
jgi:hypothetical protein